MNVLFLNVPWFISAPQASNPDFQYIRRGLRAGSRWPYTEPSPYHPDQFKIGAYVPAPMFLMSAAAWARKALPQHNIVIRDSIARGESYESFARWLLSCPPDFVILETGAASWEHDRRQLRSIKKRWPLVKIAVAGPPARSLSISDPGGVVDAWLLGEYEKTSVTFVNGQNGTIPFDLLTDDELNTMPFPMYDEEASMNYFDANPKGAKWPELTVWTSRSCVFRCQWCAWPATMTGDDPDGTKPRTFRKHSPEWLEAHIRHRLAEAEKNGAPIASIRLDDDTANAGNAHTLAFCAVMKRIGLPWSAMCRADMITRDVWQEMKDSGCFGVKIGFESGVQRVIDEVIKKHLNLEKAVETVRFLRSIGMTVHGTFGIGNPGETAEEQQQTIEFIEMLKATGAIDSAQLSGVAEIPGTPMANAVKTDPNYVSNPDGGLKRENLIGAK